MKTWIKKTTNYFGKICNLVQESWCSGFYGSQKWEEMKLQKEKLSIAKLEAEEAYRAANEYSAKVQKQVFLANQKVLNQQTDDYDRLLN